MSAVLEVKDLQIAFGGVRAVDGCGFDSVPTFHPFCGYRANSRYLRSIAELGKATTCLRR